MWVGKAVIFRWSIVAIIVLSAMIWGYFIIIEGQERLTTLPFFGKPGNGEIHKVTDFSLVSQDGKTITQNDFKNKIYVTDFFFVNCEGICPLMSDQLVRVADAYKTNPDVLLLSHTVKPEEDSIPVLKQYALNHNADPAKWHFVTGNKSEINTLARTSYLLSNEEDDGGIDFVHTQFFALVDPQKRIRGIYDGTDSTAVNKLITDIAILLREE